MTKVIPSVITSLLLASSINVQAQEQAQEVPESIKHFTVGVGTYALVVANDNSYYDDDELAGFGVSAMYSFYDNFAVKGQYYSLEHDDFSSLEDTGFDFVGYFGTGLATEGFKAYIGGGLFNESWKMTGFSKGFSGLQLNGGIGYSWEVVAIDLVLGMRDAGDYKDFAASQGISLDPSAVSSSLTISARF